MKRTQIQLEPEDHRALKVWATRRGISLAAAVRWLIREQLRGGPDRSREVAARFREALGAIRGRKGDGAVSARHDEVLYGSERPR